MIDKVCKPPISTFLKPVTLGASLLVAVLLRGSALINGQASEMELPNLIDTIRPEVVQVAIHITDHNFPPSPNPYPCFEATSTCIIGTGFFVNSKADVVTALHVVDGFHDKDGKENPGAIQVIGKLQGLGIHSEIVIGVSTPNIDRGGMIISSGTQLFPAKLIATDAAHDLAVIQAIYSPFTNMPTSFAGPGTAGIPQARAKHVTLSIMRPRDAEEIFACGYPLSEHGLITTSGRVASAWSSTILLRAGAEGISTPTEVYKVDLRINPGNSGGPVYRASDQSVLGVAVETIGSLGNVVPAKFVVDFLTAQHITWTPAALHAESRTMEGRTRFTPKQK